MISSNSLKKLICLLSLMLFIPSFLYAETIFTEGRGEAKVIYRATSKLNAAEVSVYSRSKRDRFVGAWSASEPFFIFPEVSDKQRVGIAKNVFDRKTKKGIYVHPTKDLSHTLQFKKVANGEKLLIYYGIPDEAIQKDQPNFLYLKVKVGTHLLKRIRIGSEPGWYLETFDLGPSVFLSRPIVLTFEVASDSPTGVDFYFEAIVI